MDPDDKGRADSTKAQQQQDDEAQDNMQVHVEERLAEETQRPQRVQGRQGAPEQRGGEARQPNGGEQVGQAGHIVEHLSRTYGYAFLIALANTVFGVAASFPKYTLWTESGAPPATPAGPGNVTAPGETAVVPRVNVGVWTLYVGLVIPTVLALRTMFATSSGDPHPLPGRERFSWKYALQ